MSVRPSNRSWSIRFSNGRDSPRYTRRPTPGDRYVSARAAISGRSELLRDEVEVQGGHDEVQEEQQEERDYHGLVDGVAHALGPALRVEALVAGHRSSHEPEQRGLDEGHEQVRQLRQLVERSEVAGRGAVLHHDREEPPAGDP